MSDVPEEGEPITTILQRASERIRGELTSEIGMILAKEQDQKAILAQIGEVYDRLLSPLIRDLVLVEMRLSSQLDRVGEMLEDMDKKGGPGASDGK